MICLILRCGLPEIPCQWGWPQRVLMVLGDSAKKQQQTFECIAMWTQHKIITVRTNRRNTSNKSTATKERNQMIYHTFIFSSFWTGVHFLLFWGWAQKLERSSSLIHYGFWDRFKQFNFFFLGLFLRLSKVAIIHSAFLCSFIMKTFLFFFLRLFLAEGVEGKYGKIEVMHTRNIVLQKLIIL